MNRRAPRGRTVLRSAALSAAAVLVVAAAPVTLIAIAAIAVAWKRGWSPRPLYRAAAWCLPIPAVWLAVGAALPAGSLAPAGRSYLTAVVLVLPVAIPAGLAAAGWAWALRMRSMAARAGGRSPAAGVAFDERQWRHQVRRARARIARELPLLTARGDVIVGAVIRAVRHPDRPLARLPASRLRAHQIIIGGTGTGKTTLLLRLWAAFMATGLRLHATGQAGAPLIVVLDCKGGADARRIADRYRQVLLDQGAGNVAVWPDDARLSLWALPVSRLITTLVDLIEHGTGGAAYYTDVMDAVVALAVEAPAGPPVSAADFLARLDPAWLAQAWLGNADRQAEARAAARQVPDIGLRFRTLFRRLGPGLDGPGGFADADAWYCILEGTAEVAVAEAQARALVEMLTSYVADGRRQVLLAVDEFSAVSRRVPIWQLYERARSLGLTIQISAQSWHGLAASEDDRYRLAGTAEGGIWLLRTAHPGPVTALAGQRASVDSSRELAGGLRWRRAGSSRVAAAPVAEPDRVRRFEDGQAAYLFRGGATYIQIKRLGVRPARPSPPGSKPADAALADVAPAGAAPAGAAPAGAAPAGAAPPGAAPADTSAAMPQPPDASAFLKEAFGPPRTL